MVNKGYIFFLRLLSINCFCVIFLGIYTIRKSVTNEQLPSPRLIGNFILQHSSYHTPPRNNISVAGIIGAQTVADDTSRREIYQNGKFNKNTIKED